MIKRLMIVTTTTKMMIMMMISTKPDSYKTAYETKSRGHK